MEKIYSVGIIGGGVSGSVTALQLAENGIDSILFEANESLVNGPPFCHLHAGGNLYPEITEEECRILMRQSIDMAKLFPESIDKRPTFFAVPKSAKYDPRMIEARLEMLREYYLNLIKEDPSNAVLGDPKDYFKVYAQKDLDALFEKGFVKNPAEADEWLQNTLQCIDRNLLKMPVFMVQEYGWNMFRLAAQAQIALESTANCNLELNSEVIEVKDFRDTQKEYQWEIRTASKRYKVQYLVNSSGFRSGELDEKLELKADRLIEFKAAYVAKWLDLSEKLPELIFHGERGTPNGMAQLTPCADGYYQIHGMTKDVTLFEGGVIRSMENKQPEFEKSFLEKLTNGWNSEELNDRTAKAIEYITHFVPSFESAEPADAALFGAQQVVGRDLNLRVAEVSFPSKNYARSEIIKASSALAVANKILLEMKPNSNCRLYTNQLLACVSKSQINIKAKELTQERGFPEALSQLLIS